jgi:DNA (cytosine-5)-methyltransferase 1
VVRSVTDKKFRHLDLFSGIGGFALAASWVWGEDHEIVSFCEIEDYPQRVLKKHWPDVPCHDDIKTLKGDSFGTIDLITGGFPCQPFSVAGKQGGSADDRHLWPEMFRVIQEAKPTWIIGENVAGLVNMVEFEQCFIDLEGEGYETQAFIIPACGIGADHIRERVWVVANTSSDRRNSRKHIQREHQNNTKRKWIPRENIEQRGEIRNDAAEIIQAYHRRHHAGGNIRNCDDVPSRVDRLKGLGNAIVPQVVVPIMQAIKSIEENL